MRTIDLREELKQLADKRRGQGQRHHIDVVLLIVIMATMSGYKGYRPIGDFVTRYKKELIEYLKPLKDRLPSFLTIRRVLMQVDTNQFSNLMFKWVSGYVELNDDEWVSIDGKAIQGSKQSEEDKQLAHMVSLFKNNSKEVLLSKQTQIKSNEIPLVQQIIEDLPLNNLIFTLDSLHCQSQTLDAIKDSGNDYVVCVKANQKKIT